MRDSKTQLKGEADEALGPGRASFWHGALGGPIPAPLEARPPIRGRRRGASIHLRQHVLWRIHSNILNIFNADLLVFIFNLSSLARLVWWMRLCSKFRQGPNSILLLVNLSSLYFLLIFWGLVAGLVFPFHLRNICLYKISFASYYLFLSVSMSNLQIVQSDVGIQYKLSVT